MKTLLLILLLPLAACCQQADTLLYYGLTDTANLLRLPLYEPVCELQYTPADSNQFQFLVRLDSSFLTCTPEADIYVNGDTAFLFRFLVGYILQMEEKHQRVVAGYREYIDAIDCDNETVQYYLKQVRLLRKAEALENEILNILKP